LIDGHPELFNVIDAISQEAIWYDGDATDDWYDPDGYDWVNDADLTNYYIDYLDQYLTAGVPVFNCEYALEYAATAYANSYAEGYVPYVTRRSLSQLTTTHPPGYTTPYAVVNEFLYSSRTSTGPSYVLARDHQIPALRGKARQ
jgi:endo-alpha-1,4-polygalactosaminidase (GH114 family)